jgi:hypothetical protein
MTLIIESVIAENDGKADNGNIWNQSEEMEPVQFVLLSGFCSTADDVDSLDEEQINDDLKPN